MNLDELRRRYPEQEIHVIHPRRAPKRSVNRFFETRPEVFQELYDMGRDAAQEMSEMSTDAA